MTYKNLLIHNQLVSKVGLASAMYFFEFVKRFVDKNTTNPQWTTNTEIEKETGLNYRAQKRAKKRLIEAGIITSEVRESNRGALVSIGNNGLKYQNDYCAMKSKTNIPSDVKIIHFYPHMAKVALQNPTGKQYEQALNMGYLLCALAEKFAKSTGDNISYHLKSASRLAKYSGLSARTVINTLKSLHENNLINLTAKGIIHEKHHLLQPVNDYLLELISIRNRDDKCKIDPVDNLYLNHEKYKKTVITTPSIGNNDPLKRKQRPPKTVITTPYIEKNIENNIEKGYLNVHKEQENSFSFSNDKQKSKVATPSQSDQLKAFDAKLKKRKIGSAR